MDTFVQVPLDAWMVVSSIIFSALSFNEGCTCPIPGPWSFTKYLQTRCINQETGRLSATLPCRTIDTVTVAPLTVSLSTAKVTACSLSSRCSSRTDRLYSSANTWYKIFRLCPATCIDRTGRLQAIWYYRNVNKLQLP